MTALLMFYLGASTSIPACYLVMRNGGRTFPIPIPIVILATLVWPLLWLIGISAILTGKQL